MTPTDLIVETCLNGGGGEAKPCWVMILRKKRHEINEPLYKHRPSKITSIETEDVNQAKILEEPQFHLLVGVIASIRLS